MKKRYILIMVILLIVAAGVWYGYSELKRTHADLSQEQSKYTVNAATLIREFENDSAAAGKKYIDQTVTVEGAIKSVDQSGVVSLGEEGTLSVVQCSMDGRHTINYDLLKPGNQVQIRGILNGYESDELLGTDVKLNFCVLVEN